MPIEEIRWRHGPESAVGKLLFQQHHKAVGLRVWQRFEDDAVHDSKYGGVCSDAEGEREHDYCGEADILAKRSSREAQILPTCLHKRFPAGRADHFLRNFEGAALQAHS